MMQVRANICLHKLLRIGADDYLLHEVTPGQMAATNFSLKNILMLTKWTKNPLYVLSSLITRKDRRVPSTQAMHLLLLQGNVLQHESHNLHTHNQLLAMKKEIHLNLLHYLQTWMIRTIIFGPVYQEYITSYFKLEFFNLMIIEHVIFTQSALLQNWHEQMRISIY